MPREFNISENLDLPSGGIEQLLSSPAMGEVLLEGFRNLLDIQNNWERLKLLEQAIAASNNGIVISDMQDPERPMIYCNPAFSKITGYELEEAIGRNCRFLQGRNTSPKAVEKIRQCLRLGIDERIILKNYRKDGTEFWNELFLSPVRDNQGELTHCIGVQTDITQRMDADAKLRRSEAALREHIAMLDIANDPIMIFDLQGQIRYWNHGAELLYGWTKTEAIGQKIHDLLQTIWQEPLENLETICRELGHWTGELQQTQRNGKKIVVRSRWTIQKNSNGEPQAILEINDDITEQQRVERELQHRDRLLAGVATATNYLLTNHSVGNGLSMALRALGEATVVDRVYLFEYHSPPSTKEKPFMVLKEYWSQSQDPALQEDANGNSFPACPYDPASYFPVLATSMADWWEQALAKREVFGSKVVDFPEPVRSIFSDYQISSIVIVPVLIQDHCWGFIGFDSCDREWDCSETEKSILLAAAGTLGGAIARYQAETELASLNTQLESLVKQRTIDIEIANQQLRQEITMRCHIESQLRHNAYHDSLTSLPNRVLLMEKLHEALHQVQSFPNYLFALLFLDLDRFKVINDSLGHAMGDSLLIEIGATLSRCIRQGKDLVARLGGDEFAIFLDNISHRSESTQVAERIIQEITKPFMIQGQEVFTGVSIGIAFSHAGYRQPEEMLRDADLVMYRAKSSGRSRYEIFDQTIHQQMVATLKLENDLRRAVKTLQHQPQFHLQYQPIVSLSDNQILGFEALVRWQHPEQGIISPLTFVPLAEETGLIVPLGEWILHQACQQAVVWQREFNPHLTINVNLSPRQFARPDLVTRITEILEETGLDNQTLKLEITESILIEQHSQTIATLKQLKEINIKLCMDDFGTGYSSLSYLHHFPMDTLKIDQSFIHQMTRESRHSKIVQTIINLAHNLDMQVVAEGVETQAQLTQLKNFGCEGGQGYLFSLPLDEDKVSHLLTEVHLREAISLGSIKAENSDNPENSDNSDNFAK